MADIINVGIAGRVYVRFMDGSAADFRALEKFKRAGARQDRERRLWFVGEHNRSAAMAACIATGGDSSGEAPLTLYAVAPDGGIELQSGWILTAADDRYIWFVNPYLPESGDRGAAVVTWEHARQVENTTGREDRRAALAELLAAANKLMSGQNRPPEPFQRRCERCGGKGMLMNLSGQPVPCPVCG